MAKWRKAARYWLYAQPPRQNKYAAAGWQNHSQYSKRNAFISAQAQRSAAWQNLARIPPAAMAAIRAHA
jgi:hypothetical protein